MAEIFKIGDLDNEQFYMLPKGLFTHPQYKDLTNTARIVYAILKDRMKLSFSNAWHDDNGDVYLLFKQENLADLLNITPRAVKSAMKSLKDVSLISTVRQGVNKPNKIYVHKLNPLTHGGEENFPMDVKKISPPTGSKLPPNNTNISETENNDTYMGAKPHRKRKVFIPPTLEEVEAHIAEKGLHINAKAFVDYYEADDWHLSNGKKMQNWRRCCTTWENNRYGASKPMKQTTQADYEDLLRELENDDKQSGYCQADS
jgi:hypothetical protein